MMQTTGVEEKTQKQEEEMWRKEEQGPKMRWRGLRLQTCTMTRRERMEKITRGVTGRRKEWMSHHFPIFDHKILITHHGHHVQGRDC